VANILTELGSIGIVEGIRDFRQPDAGMTEVQGFFAEDVSTVELSSALHRCFEAVADLFPSLGSPSPRFSIVEKDAWHDRWREHFPPLAVGERFLVLPPWESILTDNTRIPLVIDPSMAFGTGHHATTQGCLEAIEMLHDAHGSLKRALDLGTGAGILAIALAKLGVPEVYATDIDPIALDEARKNSDANGVTERIRFSDLSIEQLPAPFSLIVANLFSSTLAALASSLRAGVERHGYAILSGIQLDQESDVLTAYPSPTWTLITRFPKDDWVTLVLQHGDS
jgi:ribosomal protein L11 methyltransferase